MNVTDYNIGESNYSAMKKGYQPYDVYVFLGSLDPWRASIIKRVLRTKNVTLLDKIRAYFGFKTKARMEDYRKIYHELMYIDHIKGRYMFHSYMEKKHIDFIKGVAEKSNLDKNETNFIVDIMYINSNGYFINQCIEDIKDIIKKYKSRK